MQAQSGSTWGTLIVGLTFLVLLCGATPAALGQPYACLGDCGNDGEVDISDLITGVNIALGLAPISTCPAFDNGSGRVTIDSLILAVRYALNGCPPAPTATHTVAATATVSRTATISRTPTDSPTRTYTSTRTGTPTRTGTETATRTPTATPTASPTLTLTASVTPTATEVPFLERASKSSAVAVSDDELLVALVNPDNDTLSVFAAATNVHLSTVETGAQPVAVVIHPNNGTAFVANRADATVVRVDGINTQSPMVSEPLAVGSEPTGLALAPSGDTLFVAEWAEGRIAVVDTATMAITDTITAPRNPRAVAVTNNGDRNDDDETLIVTEFYGDPNPDPGDCPGDNPEVCDTGRIGRVRRYRVSDLTPQTPILFQPIASGFAPTTPPEAPMVMTAPNQLYSAAVQGGKVYVTSVSASPEPPITFQANVFPVLYVGDLASGMEDRSNVGSANLARLATDQIPPPDRRFFLQEIVDLAFDGDSNVAYVVSRAADTVQRLTYDAGAGIIIGTDEVKQIGLAPDCQNPIGIAIAPGLRRAFVNCWLTRRLGVIDLDLQALARTLQSAPLPAPNTPEDDIRLGARFYFTGRGRWSNNGEGYSSCGSCHPDGLSDGITWSFAAGPRQTTSMDGSFSHGTGPQQQRQFNWTGIFDEIHDFERNTRGVSGGLGAITVSPTGMCGELAFEEPVPLPADGLGLPVKVVQDTTPGVCTTDWDKIDAFSKTIRPPRARRDVDPLAVARGADLFTGDGACHTCHAGPGFTAARRFWVPSAIANDALMVTSFEPPTFDAFWSLNPFQISGEVAMSGMMPAAPNEITCGLRNVGTFGIPGSTAATEVIERRANGAAAQGRGGFNVPSLYGLAVGAPYFHHGQASSLEDALGDSLWAAHLTAGNPGFAPNSDDIADLVAYLHSLDADAAEPALREGFDGCPEEFPTYVAHLDGSQEVPPVAITATAEAVFQLDRDGGELTFVVRILGIDPAQITQAHLHVGPPGFNGPPVMFLVSGSPTEPVLRGTLSATDLIANEDVSVATFDDFIDALAAGDVYVNIHTVDHPDGEIRGQVQAPVTLVSTLSGDQEVPAVASTGGGSMNAELSADRSRLRFTLAVTGLPPADILQAHLHVAPPGFNGPVVLFLTDGPPASLPLQGELSAADLIPRPDAGIVDFEDFVAALLAGNIYANVHTPAQQSGEVRGQVVPPRTLPATLDGQQEVDPVVTDAGGRAQVTLNAEGTALRFALTTTGIATDDILQAHLHAAPRGFNGPVVLFLAEDGFAPLRVGTLTADDLVPNPDASIETLDDFVEALSAGDIYVNVHTVAEPSGEVRGQLQAPLQFITQLNGFQQVPMVATGATGRARIVLAPDRQSLDVTLVTSLPMEEITQAHIHVGSPGMNGGPAFFIAESGFTSPVLVTLRPADFLAPPQATTYEAFLDALASQNTYVNIHTLEYPDGEIRGQIDAPLVFNAMLSGAQEVPPVTTTASGTGRLAITADRTRLRFALAVENLPADDIQQAHIHVALPGENGPVALFLADDGFTNLRLGTLTPADFLTSPDVPTFVDFVEALFAGGAYMNVHTVDEPDGEVRGQLE